MSDTGRGAGAPFVAVLDYGIGNLASAARALTAVGADARLVREPDAVAGAAGVVLPGVGAFGAAARALRVAGLDSVVRDVLRAGTPFLGICVGLQLLFEGSEEDPDEPGLGLLEGRVRGLPPTVKRPQMQWSPLGTGPTTPPEGGVVGASIGAWMYFVHSYAPEVGPDVVATCEYGGPVVAAVERGTLVATQFHPEKSGAAGLELLARFVARCRHGDPDRDPDRDADRTE